MMRTEATVGGARRTGLYAAGRAARKATPLRKRGTLFWGPPCPRMHVNAAGLTQRFLMSGNFTCVRCVDERQVIERAEEAAKRGDPARTPLGCWFPEEEWMLRNLRMLRRSAHPATYLRVVEEQRGEAARILLEAMWRQP